MCCSTRHHPSRRPQAGRAQGSHVQADGFFMPGRRIAVLRAARKRRGERGSAILETFLSMSLLGIILFGALQIFQLAVAQMTVEYAAFRGARSAAVGLKREWAFIESLVKSAPASGQLRYNNDQRTNIYEEETILQNFMFQKEGFQDIEYSYWSGEMACHTDYRCPDYGQPMRGGCSVCGQSRKPYVEATVNGYDDEMHFRFSFRNYPLTVPLYQLVTGYESVSITGDSELTNHSSRFLE